ncbi:hypothetical protein OJ997_11925 [Solirubrobacter phytolaccae]|uniref:Uncharacterized protein n=1 Tax=Solirubrobacter phytolaccae TaxID=1404360 RepID=A0A9X3N7N5_9ACTN|nr:hypothetical protein [Solirubrobacter phytolaccae]MDA0181006.1 hypothetical protein [Solirubrobacter phytolaccae]
MERLRQIGTVIGCVWGGGILGRLISDWILGLDRGWVRATVIVFMLIGLAIGISAARELEPWNARDRRDAKIGWGIVLAFVALIAVSAVVAG